MSTPKTAMYLWDGVQMKILGAFSSKAAGKTYLLRAKEDFDQMDGVQKTRILWSGQVLEVWLGDELIPTYILTLMRRHILDNYDTNKFFDLIK